MFLLILDLIIFVALNLIRPADRCLTIEHCDKKDPKMKT